MKYLKLILSLLIWNLGSCQPVRPLKVDVLTKIKNDDTIFIKIFNTSTTSQDFNISLEVLDENEWKEIYNNIFEKDRERIQKFTLKSAHVKVYKFALSEINEQYKKLYCGYKFRFIINVFPSNPLEGLLKVPTDSFKLKTQ